MLRVAKEHLPPGSAVHRAEMDGQQWTNVEALIWGLWHKLDTIDARLVWQKRKKPKWPKFKAFPWSRDSAEQIGNREGYTDEQVLSYLRSLAPPGSKL